MPRGCDITECGRFGAVSQRESPTLGHSGRAGQDLEAQLGGPCWRSRGRTRPRRKPAAGACSAMSARVKSTVYASTSALNSSTASATRRKSAKPRYSTPVTARASRESLGPLACAPGAAPGSPGHSCAEASMTTALTRQRRRATGGEHRRHRCSPTQAQDQRPSRRAGRGTPAASSPRQGSSPRRRNRHPDPKRDGPWRPRYRRRTPWFSGSHAARQPSSGSGKPPVVDQLVENRPSRETALNSQRQPVGNHVRARFRGELSEIR